MEKTKKEIGNDTQVPSNKPKKKFLLPLVLILVLIGAVGYIAYDKYQEKTTEKELEIFQTGAQYGVESVLLEIFNEATTCNTVPINNGTLEINLIATECLAQAPQE